MPASKKPRIPTYRLHKQSGHAVVTLTDGTGIRRDVLLGKYDSPESHATYERVILEWSLRGRRPAPAKEEALSVNEVMLAYWQHVQTYYRRADGSPTTEVNNIRLALRPLKSLYGTVAASEFDALGLEAVREQMIRDGHCRNRVNKDVARIKRCFRWAGSKKLVPSSVYHDLATVEGLHAGRSEARETDRVQPVARSVVETTLTVMTATLADMVRLQLLSGMRPGEVCGMRATNIDMIGDMWIYRPEQHKTRHHGHVRAIPLGPRCREIVRRHLKVNVQDFLFSPRDAAAEFRAELRRTRKTKVQPSQQDRSKAKPKRQPGDRYTTSSYANAIADACAKAFPPPPHLLPRIKETKKEFLARLSAEEKGELKAWRKAHRWHPHQLRHTRAQELKREAGLDVARAQLGHQSVGETEHYAQLDISKAAELMARIG
jgi:integrase